MVTTSKGRAELAFSVMRVTHPQSLLFGVFLLISFQVLVYPSGNGLGYSLFILSCVCIFHWSNGLNYSR